MEPKISTRSVNSFLQRGVQAAVCAFMVALTTATIGFAQEENTVTLRYDKGDAITGEILEFTDGKLHMQTRMGRLTIPADGVTCIGNACPEKIRFVSTLPQVILASEDDTLRVTGNLLEIANGQYVLATAVGEMRLSIDEVTCEGEGCPTGASAGLADDPLVVLTNGSTTIEGRLIEFKEQTFIVDVEALGIMRINSNAFDCVGTRCP